MASPFKFFRKYSAGMMIVLVILSMLIFTLDSLFSDSALNLWLLGMLIGGAVFGIAGIGQGRWLQWGIGGAVLGTILGLILPGFVETNGLSTALGVIDDEEMNDLELRRAICNQLLIQATEASFGEGTGRFAPLFGFGHSSSQEDVIFGKLMRAEADRLGITVDRSMVNDYLMRATSEKLTKENYLKIRNNLVYDNKPVTDDVLFEILGEEVKARMAYQTLRPRTSALPPGPEVYWEYFRRLNVRQQLETVALDVDSFVGQIPNPSDAEISQLYTQYKSKFPNEEAPGSAGFRLPFRAKLAYLELDYASMEAQAGEVTDADIEKYYAENKETPLIRTPVIPDAPAKDPASETKPEEKKADGAAPEGTAPDAAKTPEAPSAEKKDVPAENTPEAKPQEEPAAEEKPPAEEKTEPAPEKSGGDSCGPTDESAAATEKPTEPAAAKTDAASETKPAAGETEKAAEAKPESPAAPPAAGEKPSDSTPDKPAPTETPDNKQPSLAIPSLTIPPMTITPGTGSPAETKPAEEIKYEYRALDDELKTEIRGEILRQRTRDAIKKKMDAAVAQMDSIARERSGTRFGLIEKDPETYEGRGEAQETALRELRESLQSYNIELNDRLKKYAKDNGLAYVETPMISYSELLNEEDYPVGSATEPNDSPFMAGQSANAATNVFQSFSSDEQNNDAQLYLVRRAQRTQVGLSNSESHYAYWAIDFSAAHIPTLEEPGIRETVILAWKRLKARDLVMKRGEELAKKIREGLAKTGEERQDPTAALKEETVNGKPDGAALAVRKTLPFSWLRTSSASPMNFQAPQASQSPVSFEDAAGGTLDLIGDTFMREVFENMKDEQVAVVPNFDMSKYYVVRVTNRFPTPEVGEDGLRERFATEGKQFAFSQSPIIGVMQQQLESPAVIAWEKAVWMRYGVNPNDDPEAAE